MSGEILARVIRGKTLESLHRGHVCILDGNGSRIDAIGDPLAVTYFRSACKSIQVIPFITSGGPEAFGFTEQEINDLWSGRKPALVRDHRFQLIIRDAMRFRAAQKAIPNAKAAPTQPSVKPGIPPSKGERQASNIQTLQQKLARTGKVDAAVALLQAKRAS